MNHLRFSSILFRLLCVLTIIMLAAPMAPVTTARAEGVLPYDVTFTQLGYSEGTLRDPFGALRYYFSIPADWKPEAGTYFQLNVGYWLGLQSALPGSSLSVLLNGQTIFTQALEVQGEQSYQVELPLDVLYLPESNLVNSIEVRFEAYVECNETNSSAQAIMDIHPTSWIHFEYSLRPLVLDLNRYPKPLYQDNAFVVDPTLVVMPNAPSEADMQTALMVSGRIGKLSNNRLPLTVLNASAVLPADNSANNLLVLGSPDDNPLISQLDLPISLSERSLAIWSEMPALVAPDQAFVLTVNVKNTATSAQNLVVKGRLPAGASVNKCSGECKAGVTAGYEWTIKDLAAGATVSNQIEIVLDGQVFSYGSKFEQTASLVNGQKLINVDSLAADVDRQSGTEKVSTTAEKGKYFFVDGDRAVSENDGVIQEILSPWNPSKVVVVVSGVTDQALLKAGQALGSKTQFPGMNGQVALIENTLPYVPLETVGEDFALQSLGYTDTRITAATGSVSRGGSIQSAMQVRFDVPYTWALTEESSLALHFAYSAAMSEMNGTLEVALNGVSVNSFSLKEVSETILWKRFALPVNRMQIGTNVLSVSVTADLPRCSSLRMLNSFWTTIFADSFIHLPHGEEPKAYDLQYFPQPFIGKSDLSNTVFALPKTLTAAQMQEVLGIAEYLGYTSKGDLIRPTVVMGGDPETQPWQGYHVIAYGRPTDNKFIAAANGSLAQPFVAGANEIVQTVDKVVYRLPSGYNLGFVQLLNSPWDVNNAMLVVTGSTNQGVSWAMNTLVVSNLRDKLKGNLAALVSADDLRVTDTRDLEESASLAPGLAQVMEAEGTATPTPEPTAAPAPTATPAAAQQVQPETVVVSNSSNLGGLGARPIWLIPLLLVSALIVVVIGGMVILRKR